MSLSPPSTGRLSPPGIRIIQELYQEYNDLGYKQALSELDTAMEEQCPVIVIEPMKLGDATARWIAMGNLLHKGAVLAGVGASLSVGALPERWGSLIWGPLALTSVSCYLGYSLSWQLDPCCKYQIEKNKDRLAALNLHTISSSSVVVLRYRDDQRRRMLHSVVALVTVTVTGYRLYNMLTK